MKYLISLILITAAITLFATTLTVKQDGTGDWTTIQSAVNASADGDTVLVWPGTYYENVNFNGHCITIASLELTTGDEGYIGTTIVNGNQTGSCFIINDHEQNAKIQGFTITNGSGNYFSGNFSGGGVFICTNYNIEPIIEVEVSNCRVTHNIAYSGGGIYITQANVLLSGVSIHSNQANIGGGVLAHYHANLLFNSTNRCNIYNNNGGIQCDIRIADAGSDVHVIVDTFTVNPPTKYFSYFFHQLDDNGELTHDVLHGWMEEVNHDLYVAPNGDDNNSGLSPDEPLQNISWAMRRVASDSLNPKTIHVAAGEYSRELTNLILPIVQKDYCRLVGESSETVTLYNDHDMDFISNEIYANEIYASGFKMINDQFPEMLVANFNCSTTVCSDLILTGANGNYTGAIGYYNVGKLVLENSVIQNNYAHDVAGAYISAETTIIRNCRFLDNHSTGAGEYDVGTSHLAIGMHGDALVENCTFGYGTTQAQWGSYSICIESWEGLEPHLTFRNNLIYNNIDANDKTVLLQARGGADVYNCMFVNNEAEVSTLNVEGSEVNIANCIFDNPTPYQITLPSWTTDPIQTVLTIDHSNVREGFYGVWNPDPLNYEVVWGEGNINEPPEWAEYNPEDLFPYRLPEGDFSIDAGRADTTGMYLPIYDLIYHDRVIDGNQDGTARIDIGCYEYDPYPVAEEDIPPYESGLTNYPNPFNPSTTIRFTIPTTSTVKIAIYNMRGQKIRDLGGITYQAGDHEIVWDGRNNRQTTVSSGVYICRMSYSGKTLYRKMMMMK